MSVDLGLPLGEKKKRRDYVNAKAVKKLHGNRCKLCGKSEKQVPLELAHYKARSKGGNLVFPLCPNCHTKYDKGLLTTTQLKKLNLTKEEYQKYRPKKIKRKTKSSPFDLPKAKFPKSLI
jgi:predicted restriction endonuclease